MGRHDSATGPWIPFDDPRDASPSRMLAGWWQTPVDYYAQVEFFTARGLTPVNRILVGAGVMMVALITTIIQFSPAGPVTASARIMAAGFAVGAAGWAVRWWIGRWPGRTASRVFVVYMDIGMTVLAMVNANASAVGVAPSVLVLLSFYLVFFEGPKILVLHAVWVITTVLLLVVNVVNDTGGDVALAVVKMTTGASLACIPVAIQFGIWTLQSEANASLLDPLTGLLNRRGTRLHLRNLLRSRTSDTDLIVVMVVDLDRFKDVNEVHGHGVGDEVLIRSARRIQLAAGSRSMVARVGGEEFVVITITPAGGVERLADAVCAAVRSTTDAVTATASIGVSSTPMAVFDAHPAVSARAWKTLLDHADEAMFEAKRDGGNRAVHLATSVADMDAPS